MNSFNRFKETQLPPIESFYSSLNLQNISENDYKLVNKIWNSFNFKNLREFTEFYCLFRHYIISRRISNLQKNNI